MILTTCRQSAVRPQNVNSADTRTSQILDRGLLETFIARSRRVELQRAVKLRYRTRVDSHDSRKDPVRTFLSCPDSPNCLQTRTTRPVRQNKEGEVTSSIASRCASAAVLKVKKRDGERIKFDRSVFETRLIIPTINLFLRDVTRPPPPTPTHPPNGKEKQRKNCVIANWDQENIFLVCCEFYYSWIRISRATLFFILGRYAISVIFKLSLNINYLTCAKNFIPHYLFITYGSCNHCEAKVFTLHSRNAFRDEVHRHVC